MARMNPTPLKFLMPGWFSVVMGLTGLALAWRSAEVALGESAMGVALVLGAVAMLVCLVLLVLSGVRANRYNAALAEDLRHPVRHGFVAALPVSLLLLAALATTLEQTGALIHAVWWVGAVGQLAATVWVLTRWLVLVELRQHPAQHFADVLERRDIEIFLAHGMSLGSRSILTSSCGCAPHDDGSASECPHQPQPTTERTEQPSRWPAGSCLFWPVTCASHPTSTPGCRHCSP